VVAGNAPWATFAWTAALSVSYALILLTGPVLGLTPTCVQRKAPARSHHGWLRGRDRPARIHRPGTLALAVLLLVLSNFCFGSGENLNRRGFLPELAQGESPGTSLRLGLGSGAIWAAPDSRFSASAMSHGGRLWQEPQPVRAGHDADHRRDFRSGRACRHSCCSRSAPARRRSPPGKIWRARPLRGSRRRAPGARYRDLARFLVCIVFYQAGIQTVIALRCDYAEQALGFTTKDTITLILGGQRDWPRSGRSPSATSRTTRACANPSRSLSCCGSQRPSIAWSASNRGFSGSLRILRDCAWVPRSRRAGRSSDT